MEATDEWRTYATICRLCLQRDGFMLGIFNHIQGKEKSIYKKIMDCTALEISFGDGLPTCICHRCLYKIEFCLEFRQLCFMSDATLRQLNGIPNKSPDVLNSNFHMMEAEYDKTQGNEPSDVVMVVDPAALDYDSEFETDDRHSENETEGVNELYECRNVSMCKFCDQAFTDKAECLAHEGNAHNNMVPYACNNCDMCFADRLQYSAHLKSVHQNDKPYNCPQCDRTFARRSDLRKHTIVHTGVKPFTCNICFKSFSRNTNLSKHMRIHSGRKPFVCPKCPKTFFSKTDLARHSIIHSGQKPFGCNYCHLTFGRKDKLLRHEKRHFPQENTEDKSQELQMMRESLSMSSYNYDPAKEQNGEQIGGEEKQDEWASSVNMVINLDPYNHSDYNHENPQQNEHQIGESETTNNNQDLPSVPDHIKGDSLQNQLPNDTSDLPSVPEHITGDSFSNNLLEKKPNMDIKRYPCLTCHKRFSSCEGLRLHNAIHSGNRPHSCGICSKAFMRKRELDRHMATHTGMRPFKCTSCEKSFGRKDKLVRHMRIHDVSREHICVICGASFNRKDGLVNHMKTHVKEETDILNPA